VGDGVEALRFEEKALRRNAASAHCLLRRLAIDRPNATAQITPHRHIGRLRIVQRTKAATFAAILIAASA
jgi:hypothetical protein